MSWSSLPKYIARFPHQSTVYKSQQHVSATSERRAYGHVISHPALKLPSCRGRRPINIIANFGRTPFRSRSRSPGFITTQAARVVTSLLYFPHCNLARRSSSASGSSGSDISIQQFPPTSDRDRDRQANCIMFHGLC